MAATPASVIRAIRSLSRSTGKPSVLTSMSAKYPHLVAREAVPIHLGLTLVSASMGSAMLMEPPVRRSDCALNGHLVDRERVPIPRLEDSCASALLGLLSMGRLALI